MNFFEKVYKIYNGTYNTTNNINTANTYFGSTTTNMTKDQLISFNAQLQAMGLNKPVGIDNMIADFTAVDTDNNGKLTSAEINAYLAGKGIITNTAGQYSSSIGSNLSSAANNPQSTLLPSAISNLSQILMGLKNLV